MFTAVLYIIIDGTVVLKITKIMYILRNNYNSCVDTEEGPQEGKSDYRPAQGVGEK